MLDIHLRIDTELADAARRGADVPPGLPTTALIRLALAKLAGWPESAALAIARPRKTSGEAE